jgi:hypothetical protein
MHVKDWKIPLKGYKRKEYITLTTMMGQKRPIIVVNETLYLSSHAETLKKVLLLL